MKFSGAVPAPPHNKPLNQTGRLTRLDRPPPRKFRTRIERKARLASSGVDFDLLDRTAPAIPAGYGPIRYTACAMDDTNSQIGGLYVVLGVLFVASAPIALSSALDGFGSGLGAAFALLGFGGLQIWSGVALRRGADRGRAGIQVFAILYLVSMSLLSIIGGLTLWLLYKSRRSHAV